MSPNSPIQDFTKVNTRSTSSTSTNKLTAGQSQSLASFSTDEFHRVISRIQRTQEEMLFGFKSLSLSQDEKHDVLKASLDELSTKIHYLMSENASLKRDLVVLKKRVLDIKTSPDNSLTTCVECLLQLLFELSEREKCSCNIVVHGLQETSTAQPTDRIFNDIKLFSEIILLFSLSLPPNLKSFRLRGVNAKRPRPLKIHFSAKELALQFVDGFNMSKQSYTDLPPTISVVRNRMVAERLEIRWIHAELEARKKNGELGVAVMYKNGVSFIVNNRHEVSVN